MAVLGHGLLYTSTDASIQGAMFRVSSQPAVSERHHERSDSVGRDNMSDNNANHHTTIKITSEFRNLSVTLSGMHMP